MKRVSLKAALLMVMGTTCIVAVLHSAAICPGEISDASGHALGRVASGGSADVLARALAEGAEKSLGQKIVVVSNPAAAEPSQPPC